MQRLRMSDSQPADLSLMRELNERIVLGLLRQEGPISRAELARRSNLSRSTVSSIIANLLAAGLVRETGIGDSNGGRRPIMIEFNYQSAFVVGIELGNSALTVLLTDLAANVLRRGQCSFELADGPDICLAQVAALVDKLLTSERIARSAIVGAGVGVPGPLAFANGRPMMPPAMPGWHDVPLRGLLEDALGMRVFVENDANLGALAEHCWGAARERFNVAYIYLGGAGIGCGLILDGRLYRGEIGSAGEIGHLMVQEDGPVCRCGANGCLEAVAGVPALLSRAAAIGLPARQAGDLIGLARAGEDKAAALIERAGEYLGVAVASILNMTNPGCVVIGGELSEAGELLLMPLRRVMRRRGLAAALEQVEIVPGQLGDDVVAFGAVSIVVQHAFSVPGLARAASDIAHETALN
jgi:predicted NBD/HSP70 family sugar kinase